MRHRMIASMNYFIIRGERHRDMKVFQHKLSKSFFGFYNLYDFVC